MTRKAENINRNTAHKQIKLLFTDLSRLWSFTRHLTNQNLEINTTISLLICDCTEEEIQKAVYEYGATLLNQTMDNTRSAS